MDEFVSRGHKFLCCDTLTPADFAVGAVYTNLFCNANRTYYKPEYEMLMKKYPKFAAYGERFRAENKAYLDKRPACPAWSNNLITSYSLQIF